jgi:Tol biopolymer transport system component
MFAGTTRWAHTAESGSRPDDSDPTAAELAAEVHDSGFVVYTALTQHGDWDLFVMRPDGTARINITRTRAFSEVGGRFSPDGTRLLYYRMPRGEVLDNNKYGTYDLVAAKADGTESISLGDNFSWASWGPDGTQLVSLSRQGIRFIDLETRSVIRKMDRRGFVEQLVWSPDGKWLVGTANGLGEQWAIGRMDAVTGTINRVSEGDCFNCTPDWFADSRRVIYSKGHPRTEGWAQLWMAEADGEKQRMLCGEIGRHLYGGSISPDGKYVLFTRSQEDLGKVDNSHTTMALMRLKDAPIVRGKSNVLREKYPRAKNGPVLDLSAGWEPHWTAAQLNFPK